MLLLDDCCDARDRSIDDLGGERSGLGSLERWENWSRNRRHLDVDNERVGREKPFGMELMGEKPGGRRPDGHQRSEERMVP